MRFDNILKRSQKLRKIGRQYIVTTAIVKRGNKYLLLKRSEHNLTNVNRWQFPEGGMDFKEKALDSLKRELKEETNLDLISAKFLDVTNHILKYFRQDVLYIIRVIFLCKAKGTIKLSNEHKDYGWFTKAQIRKLPLNREMNFEQIKYLL